MPDTSSTNISFTKKIMASIDQWIVDEALEVANQRDKGRKSSVAYGGRWWEVPFGFPYRHRFNLTSLEKFGVEELRELVWKVRDGESEMVDSPRNSEQSNVSV